MKGDFMIHENGLKIEYETLHQLAISTALKFHQAESELIDILQKIDNQKIFVYLGYSSLFDYAVKALKLSEANASNFITIARKSISIPELKLAIEAGELTVSKARKITPVLTQENSQHWIGLAKTLPKVALEKEVAKVMPQTLIIERAKYVAENRLELKLGVSEEIIQKLKRAQDLESQRTNKAANFEDTLRALLEFYLQRQDPVEKAKRNNQDIDANASVPGHAAKLLIGSTIGSTNGNASRRFIPAQLKHQIVLRDQNQCVHIDPNGFKCTQKRWLDIHHIKPVSLGGKTDLHNLQTLCHYHHKQMHF